jgi:hypothetical protein
MCFGTGMVSSVVPLVIPGCAARRRPGIHTPGGGYGSSDVQLHIKARDFVAPRNDDYIYIPSF